MNKRKGKISSEKRAERYTTQLEKQLDLSEEQKEEIEELYLSMTKDIEKERTEREKGYTSRIVEIRKTFNQSLTKILNEEQVKLFEEMEKKREEMKKKREEKTRKSD
jgi:hypothetical protein